MVAQVQKGPFSALADFLNMSSPTLGYLVAFAIYCLCFLLSSAVLFKVHEPREAVFAAAGWGGP